MYAADSNFLSPYIVTAKLAILPVGDNGQLKALVLAIETVERCRMPKVVGLLGQAQVHDERHGLP